MRLDTHLLRLCPCVPIVAVLTLALGPAPVSAQKDIGVHNLCVTRGDPAKTCSDVLYTGQAWHSRFQVVNKGMKPVSNWAFSIFVVHQGNGRTIIVKDQVDGTPLNPGQIVTINWPSHYLFTSADKGPWQIVVDVRVKQANPDVSPTNNRTIAQFVVENKPEGVSDIGIDGVCVTRATAAAKQCTDVLFTEQPWHVMFKVVNKGEKAVEDWSFDIVLSHGLQPPIVVKQQVAGQPLPVGGVTTMNWPVPQIFTPADKGEWTVDVIVEVKDPTNPEPPELQINNRGSATFGVENKPTPRSDIGLQSVCVTRGGPTIDKICTDVLYTQQPWHVMFQVVNKGDKAVDDWSFDIFLFTPGQPLIPLKQQVAGPPVALGATVTVNWPSPLIFDPTQKGDWRVVVLLEVKDPGNPEPPELQGNNRGSAGFRVENKPVGISDIGIETVCVTRATAADKICTGTLFTQQPWHVLFKVINKGEKAIDDWSFDIVLQLAVGTNPIVLKQQVAGPPLAVGGSTTINWPSPFIFDPTMKGDWFVTVRARIKEPDNLEPVDRQGNNQQQVFFVVENKPTPRSDIGVSEICVTRADTLKECTDLLFTQQPWHVQFKVANKGDKAVDDWSFDIFLSSPNHPTMILKQQIAGTPLPVGAVATINWPSPHIFDPTQKGQWSVRVVVSVKDPSNPEPPPLLGNNSGTATFTVRNKEIGVSDIGIQDVCVTRADPIKQCSPVVFTRQPWHVMFTVINKGEKSVDDWSFDILLFRPGQVPLVLKQQVPGTPLPVGGNVTINWPSPHIFDGSQKGQWQIGVRVEVKDPGNPEPPDRQDNNRAIATFLVENKTEISDIGLETVCVTLDNLTKDCSPHVFIGQPWHIKFVAINKGEKALDNWSFDISLTGASDLLIKQQVPGPVIPVGGSVTINWPSPLTFDPVQYGQWSIGVGLEVKDPTNPEPPALQQNNRGSVTFRVVNKVSVDDFTISEARLRHNVPNPFGVATTIQFDLPRAARTHLEVFDLNGRLVKRLITTEVGAGSHTTTWDGTDESGARAAAGVYIYRLQAGEFLAARRMVLIN